MFSDVIYLITETKTKSDMGSIVTTPTKRKIYADKLEVGMKEFYESAMTGLEPELKFRIRTSDYQSERKVEYNGKTYAVLRSYAPGDFTELTLHNPLE